MATDDGDRVDDPASIGKRIGETDHSNLSAQSVEAVSRLLRDIEDTLERDEYADSAEKLLSFWEGYLGGKLEAELESDTTVEETRIDRIEQGFEEGLIGVDLYEAIETLAIVADIPEEQRDVERLRGWTRRAVAMTKDFQTHLENHLE